LPIARHPAGLLVRARSMAPAKMMPWHRAAAITAVSPKRPSAATRSPSFAVHPPLDLIARDVHRQFQGVTVGI
jgi:hypothetical protein